MKLIQNRPITRTHSSWMEPPSSGLKTAEKPDLASGHKEDDGEVDDVEEGFLKSSPHNSNKQI